MKMYDIQLKSLNQIYRHNKNSKVRYWFWGILLLLIIFMFLPWTQNIKSRGQVTTLFQNQRPQEVNSPIPGRIAKWYAKEGDYLSKGDTILQLTEIKEDYLDPNLVGRTKEQAEAKKQVIQSYQGKIKAGTNQIEALKNALDLKSKQLRVKVGQMENKILGEQAELEAATNEVALAKDQYTRQQKMYADGLVSQTQLQQRNVSYQNSLAKKISIENKLAQTRQELTQVMIEQNQIVQEYNEKISKAESERFQGMGQVAAGQGELAKLENQVVNYSIRNGMYYLLALQDGQMVQAKKGGIGEVVKEGERIATIVPTETAQAVELYIRPVDLPLISKGQKVRFIFDGFPAVVFSGWPNNSYGTFGGEVISYESNISDNNLFRIMVVPDSNERPWPSQLKIGAGAQGIALLKDVPIWYELWRNINGFPPDFYTIKQSKTNGSKDKK